MNWKRMVRRSFIRNRTATCTLHKTGRAALSRLVATDLVGDSLFPGAMSWRAILRERREDRAYRRSERGRARWIARFNGSAT